MDAVAALAERTARRVQGRLLGLIAALLFTSCTLELVAHLPLKPPGKRDNIPDACARRRSGPADRAAVPSYQRKRLKSGLRFCRKALAPSCCSSVLK